MPFFNDNNKSLAQVCSGTHIDMCCSFLFFATEAEKLSLDPKVFEEMMTDLVCSLLTASSFRIV